MAMLIMPKNDNHHPADYKQPSSEPLAKELPWRLSRHVMSGGSIYREGPTIMQAHWVDPGKGKDELSFEERRWQQQFKP